MSKFLLKIQMLVHSLSVIGEPVSSREHLNIIPEGLLHDYESKISLICGKSGPVFISEVQTLFLGHEARLARFNKSITPSVNLVTASYSSH